MPLQDFMPGIGPSRPLPDAVPNLLVEAGVSPRLKRSIAAKVPSEIARLESYKAFPAKPFGMVGPSGIGKSSALVAAMRQAIYVELLEGAQKTRFRWIYWVSTAIDMKGAVSRGDWDSPRSNLLGLTDWVLGDPEHHVLILDDMGMEFPKGAKAQENPTRGWTYTSEHLERMIDDLWNNEAKVFWTSQRKVTEMEALYGERLLSRLIGLSPDVELPPNMPDLRIKAAP